MSGPIIGRRPGRRQNNSEIGSLETIHDAGTGSPSNRANTYEDSRAFNYGIRTMDQVTRGVFNSTYRDLASGGGGSTVNHQVFLIQLVVMLKLLVEAQLEKMLTILQEVQTH